MIDYAAIRANMVENQLRPNRIDDPAVLEAMAAVPRELFVPEALRDCAYGDEDLALGGGRFLIEPLALAKLLQAAAPKPLDVVLTAGDTTGYVAAALARMVGSVFWLLPPDIPPEPAASTLEALACGNVVLRQGPPEAGLPDRAPFDLVLLAGAVPALPQPLLDQLGENGRLVGVVEHGRSGKVTVARKVHGAVGRVTPFDAHVHRLPGMAAEPAFTF
jgi:protein-L-isoaspartate(D-aspartate) O-methyltransferase